MSQRIATEDITHRNDLGQLVVLVPKGQPIPDALADRVAVKKVPAPTEDKSRRGPRGKKA